MTLYKRFEQLRIVSRRVAERVDRVALARPRKLLRHRTLAGIYKAPKEDIDSMNRSIEFFGLAIEDQTRREIKHRLIQVTGRFYQPAAYVWLFRQLLKALQASE